jgi:hypothetical protein
MAETHGAQRIPPDLYSQKEEEEKLPSHRHQYESLSFSALETSLQTENNLV